MSGRFNLISKVRGVSHTKLISVNQEHHQRNSLEQFHNLFLHLRKDSNRTSIKI